MRVYYDVGCQYQRIDWKSWEDKDGKVVNVDHTFLNIPEEDIDIYRLRDYELHHNWIYYHHDDDDDWSLDSFKVVFELNTVYDLWDAFNQIKTVQNGKHFIVRDDVSPCWDNPENSHLWWIKRKKMSISEAMCAWTDLTMCATGLCIFKEKDNTFYQDAVNSISVSYKDGDYVFSIMLNKNIDDPSVYNTIKMGNDFSFDFVNGGRLIENTGGKKKENYAKKTYGGGCKKFSPKKNYRQPLREVN